ncbi:transcription-repair coupling factor [Enterovirga aerilata]|uniref:Transcription-repair-coupling factor n=1 Tax=Enterovirga aerilata TaxID=2730920 RepID=A0A849HWC1_9HYPH|nr:transcription-repair coupling factor [Enterovirga sp. DB1703]NNM71836.1 transcription-repair coupling factor [Enterovirga sp. DB1703]
MAIATRARSAASHRGEAADLVLPAHEALRAIRLVAEGREAGRAGLVLAVGSEGRIERLARLIWALAPDIQALIFPPWDCLPYDRSPPSARAMGLRIAALSWLAGQPDRPWILITTSEGLLQRVPPRDLWESATVRLSRGGAIDVGHLGAELTRIGYREDDRVDEAGEFAVRGHVVDVFPAGYYLPVRIEHEDGQVTAISSYDAASQRRTDEFDELILRPASEAVTADRAGAEASPLEHRLPLLYPSLETIFDYAPRATILVEPRAEERRLAFLEQVADAQGSRARLDGGQHAPASGRLYLTEEDWQDLVRKRSLRHVVDAADGADETVPSFAAEARPAQALARFLKAQVEEGRRVLAAAGSDRDLRGVARSVERALGRDAERVRSWDEVLAAKPGAALAMVLDLDRGFVDPRAGVAAISPPDLLGSRARRAGAERAEAEIFDDEEFRVGDAVIHLEHGLGLLEGIEAVSADGSDVQDTIRLSYAGDAKLMVPVSDIDLMWRYGSAEGVSLDRLGGASWPKRRAKVEAEINKAAVELARIAAERRAIEAPAIHPPRRDYERFVARFPYSETADQNAAVADILRDLASGRAMDRLVCGDVGFGKTEVALRAAAAVALSGKQVAIVAPTTVLVRQHLQTFRRRFADFGIEVAHLSRLVKPAEAKAVKAGLADGSVRIVVGTHALAGKGVAFADLGLLVIDEEQRFGTAHKDRLRALGAHAHVLTLTATPIPRTLQSALVGLQDVSVLATPPAERQPVRTFVAPFDGTTIRTALLRERRRGGQSFVVCPRIEDIEPMAAQLKGLVPELDILVAHGKLPAEQIDETMVRFADGEGDVLLATNIIESGLDVPRANTIMVWRANMFGLAQLHQLRGRVGRGRPRGIAYLLTDPDEEVSDETRKRLGTLERLDRLGAGFAISAEDLEQRGGGDLLGEMQAGHVKLIGAGLYRRLLERALLTVRGETPPEEWVPELNIGVSARIPADYVPEPEVRLNLYAKIARSLDGAAEARIADEIEDRFGPPPEEVAALLALNRLKRLCRQAGIAKVDAGPQGIALTFKDRTEQDLAVEAALKEDDSLGWRNGRLVSARPTETMEERLEELEALLQRFRLDARR